MLSVIMSTNMIRIRLFLERPSPKSGDLPVKKCWMMVNFNTCKLVKDLERTIVERFFPNECVKLSLSVDDFVLPPEEIIHIVHENDIIRVEVADDEKAIRSDENQQQCSADRIQYNEESVANEKSKEKKKKKKKRQLSETDESRAYPEESSCGSLVNSVSKGESKSKKQKKQKTDEDGNQDINMKHKEKDAQRKQRTKEEKKRKKEQDKSLVSWEETGWTGRSAEMSTRQRREDQKKQKPAGDEDENQYIKKDHSEKDLQRKQRTNKEEKKRKKEQDKSVVSGEEMGWTESGAEMSTRQRRKDQEKQKLAGNEDENQDIENNIGRTSRERSQRELSLSFDSLLRTNEEKKKRETQQDKSVVSGEEIDQSGAEMPTRKRGKDKAKVKKSAAKEECASCNDGGESFTSKADDKVVQQKPQSAKSKESASASQQELQTSLQNSKNKVPKNKNEDSRVSKQNASNESSNMSGSLLTRQDISKVVDQKLSIKQDVAKTIGQRLKEISQVSNVRLPSTSKSAKKSKGHIRFSSSSESSSESSSDSSSESSSASLGSTLSKEKGKQLPVTEKSLSISVDKSDLASTCQSSNLKSNSDMVPQLQQENGRSNDKPISDSIPNQIEKDKSCQGVMHPNSHKTSLNVAKVTENGVQDSDSGSVTNQEESWRGGYRHYSRRGRRSRGWNPMSKIGQLNTQLHNKSIVMLNPKVGDTDAKAVDAVPAVPVEPKDLTTFKLPPQVGPPRTGDEIAHKNPEVVDSDAKTVDTVPAVPVEPKDYSTFPPLVGPPRTGDKIAYKVLELSNIYCPEVSEYKEAEVVSYNLDNQTIEVKLTSAHQQPVKRRGRFELHFEKEEGEEEKGKQLSEPSNLVSIQLSSLIEPKLLPQ